MGQNQVLLLNGVDSYVDLGDPIIATNKFTIEAWANPFGPGGGYQTLNIIFTQRDDAAGCYHSSIGFSTSRSADLPYPSCELRSTADCGYNCLGDYQLGYEMWHHYAYTSNGTYIKIYHNGQLIDQVMVNSTGDYMTSIDYVFLGRQRHSGIDTGWFFGMLDEVRIWDHPRTQAEIQAGMFENFLPGEPGLEAYWTFNDGTAADMTNHGHDGTLMGGAAIVPEDGPEECETSGDVDGNGLVDIADIISLVDYILDLLDEEIDLLCSDLNMDGIVDILDLQRLVNLLLY